MELRELSVGNEATVRQQASRPAVALTVITSLFFIFGFLTCMNDILVPHLKGIFTLNYAEAALVQFCFFSAYFLTSIPSSRFCERKGYKAGMITGLAIMCCGTLGLIGSASMASFPMFLAALFALAVGITLLQVAANPYVTLLGDPAKGPSRLNLVQAFNSLGTMVAPMIGSALILGRSDAHSIQQPYWVITLGLAALALAVSLYPFPAVQGGDDGEVSYGELLRDRRLLFGAIGIFAYVGAEVSIGSFLINWLGDPSVRGFTAEQAGRFVTFYWGGAMVGRFLGTPLLARYQPGKVLGAFVTGALLLVVTTMFSHGAAAQWSILAVGLMNSIMFPTIFSMGLGHLRKGTAKASGLLCTAIVGGAILPILQGSLADHVGLRMSFIVPALGYAYLLVLSSIFARTTTTTATAK